MKKGFTIVEVSILFVIFLIVALLVTPLSLSETAQVKNEQGWVLKQSDFSNYFDTINAQKNDKNFNFDKAFDEVLKNEIKAPVKPYKITFMNGTYPNLKYRFTEFYSTYSNAVISVKMLTSNQSGLQGMLMYDVNGSAGPNVWGKDVYGLNIYKDKFEPFCKTDSISTQRQECSKEGSGLCCSNYVLMNRGSLN